MAKREVLMALALVLCCMGPGLKRTAAQGVGKTSNVAWVKFEDPLEHAFSVDVPQDWTVKGGLFRLGFSDTRMMVDMKSPDGKIEIRMGMLRSPAILSRTNCTRGKARFTIWERKRR